MTEQPVFPDQPPQPAAEAPVPVPQAVTDPAATAEDFQVAQDVPPEPAAEPAEPAPGLPDALASHPDVGTEEAPGVFQPATSNESAQLPPGAQAAAAHGHALLAHIAELAAETMHTIERFVPADMLRVARASLDSSLRNR